VLLVGDVSPKASAVAALGAAVSITIGAEHADVSEFVASSIVVIV